MESVESQIAEWQAYVANAPGVNERDVDELEDHLRGQIAELDSAASRTTRRSWSPWKQMGDLDGLSRSSHGSTAGDCGSNSSERTTSRRARPTGSSHSSSPRLRPS